MAQNNFNSKQNNILTKIKDRIKEIRQYMIEQGYSNQKIQCYLIKLLYQNNNKSALNQTLTYLNLNKDKSIEQALYSILEKCDIECSRVRRILKQQKIVGDRDKLKKFENKKQLKLKKTEKPKNKGIETIKLQVFEKPNLSSQNDSQANMFGYDSSLKQTLLKAELLKDLLSQKIFLAELCQRKMNRLSQMQGIDRLAFEMF